MTLRRLRRPAPPLTPLQQALWHFGEALWFAKTDARTFGSFLAVVGARIAAEEARRLDREPRP